ncbi:MAG TPA: alpha/beta hydrolase [Candidatus Binatia bacterium]|jgi:pimeloyl-ACP methyl ester carboxylesterase|nr:alpha/beta hydrolase [Candidatus Binatia bacterium]
MPTTEPHEEFIAVAGAKIHLLKGGQGRPLVVLHSVEGSLGWRSYHRQLAQHFTVYAPTLPGFGPSERPAWLETFPDLARFSLWLLQELQLEKVSLLGNFIGGWLAAEMAVMSPQILDRLVLVDAAGIQPIQGEITDIFLHGHEGTRNLIYFDPQQTPEYQELFGRKPTAEEREIQAQNQETAIRYCWKPYMYDRSLPWLLPRIRVPTLIVWGREDRLVPLECGELYRQAIPGARLEVINRCGTSPPLEKPEQFSALVRDFLLQA